MLSYLVKLQRIDQIDTEGDNMGSKWKDTMPKVRELEKGIITVEAAFILPTVLFVLVLILFFFFYGFESGTAAGILQEEVGKAGDVGYLSTTPLSTSIITIPMLLLSASSF